MLVGAGPRLAAQAELLDEGPIALEILALKVVQEAAAAADELQQSTTRIVVVLVTPRVLVSSLMRCVSIAICTSGEPVSVSCLPNFPTCSSFSSLVRGMLLLSMGSPWSQRAAKEVRARPRPGRSVG